jgi:hypothetical protein
MYMPAKPAPTITASNTPLWLGFKSRSVILSPMISYPISSGSPWA